MPEPPRFYLDANVYLAWLRGEEGRVDTARELLTAAEAHRLTIVASTLIYAEVCGHGEIRSSDAEGVDAKIRTFFERGFSGGSRWTYQRLATLGRYPGSSDSEEPTPSTCRRRSEERQSAS